MPERPYTVLSCAVSMDGYLDGPDGPLPLSNPADLDRVDAVRAGCDAILVGARTVRRDDPRLRVRSAARRAARVAAGRPPTPLRVTLTRSADLDPAARLFGPVTSADVDATGPEEARPLVFCATAGLPRARRRLADRAELVDAGADPQAASVLADLAARGVERLLVEGGATLLTGLLAERLADELQLVVAPLLVGDRRASRMVADARFPWTAEHRAPLHEVRRSGDVVLLRYALTDRFDPVSDPTPDPTPEPAPSRPDPSFEEHPC